MTPLPDESQRLERQRDWLIVVCVLLPIQTLLSAWLACRYSPTSDEMAHLAAGVRIWTERDFNLYTVNPPLPKLLAAVPVMIAKPQVSWKQYDPNPALRREWNVGQDFMWANSTRSLWLYTLARWASIPWSWLGLIVCFLWARDLYGSKAGVIAAATWSFSPALLANAALITPDVPAASMAVITLYRFRQYLSSPDWRWAFITGVYLGLGQLTKMTLLLLYPLLLILMIFPVENTTYAGWTLGRRISAFCFCVFVSLVVLNACYLFEGTGRTLGERDFYSESLGGNRPDWNTPGNRFRGTALGMIPVPLPTAYLTGLDLQKRDFEGHWRPMYSYLGGHQQLGGWWYYYLYCILVKVPAGIWLIIVAFIASLQSKPVHRRYEMLLLWLTPLALFAFVSSQTGFSRYYRYVLPCAPFVLIGLSRVFAARWSSSPRWWTRLGYVGLVCLIVESLWVYPHSLAFFNVLAGGTSAGHTHLLDSNVDWGQDLYHLRDWMNQHPHRRPLYVAYSGVFDPHVMGIDTARPPEQTGNEEPNLSPGWYAVSVNHIHGYDDPAAPFGYFLSRTPVDRAGYSILIYHVAETPP